jgi:predicted Zn-dependent peptidase
MKWKLLLLAASFGSAAHATSVDQIKTFTLKNGMQFIVLESNTIPNANMYTFWKVGSRNEVPGITGLSHFFEHMMFNGSKNYGPKMFDRTMEANGGANNAYTTNDLTVYTNWFPANALETIFKLESDRIGHLSIDPKMVQSERGVVLSERSTGLENSNERLLHEQITAAAFTAHPYSWSVIGHESDIKAWTQADLVKYFQTYYAPNNAVTVIVGDVKFDAVKKLATRYFDAIPARPLPPKVRTVEPPQQGEKRVFVRKESATSPNLTIAFKVPQLSHPDSYALDVLHTILAGGKTSRLYQALVEKRLATRVGAESLDGFDPGLLYLNAVAAPNVTAEQLEQAMLAELERLKKDGISETELQKVKNQKVMDLYRALETINGTANSLGSYQVFYGDYKKLFSAPAAYQALTVANITEVANKYLKKSQRTVGVLAAEEK